MTKGSSSDKKKWAVAVCRIWHAGEPSLPLFSVFSLWVGRLNWEERQREGSSEAKGREVVVFYGMHCWKRGVAGHGLRS
jgi:hypothetical protein